MTKRISDQTGDGKKYKKKLQKREERLLKRLDEARERYENAQERLQRAQERVQKRKGRVERLEGRLAFLRQQSQRLIREESESETETTLETSSLADVAMVNNLEEALTSAEGEEVRPPVAAEEEEDVVLLVPMAEEDIPDIEHLEEVYSENEGVIADPAPLEQEEKQEVVIAQEEHIQGYVTEEGVEIVEPDLLEEERENILQNTTQEPALIAAFEVDLTPEPAAASTFSEEVLQLLQQARELAQSAERATHVATQRTSYLLEHLEQMLDGRYLYQELEQLQSETETLSALSQSARTIVDALEASSTQSGENLTLFAQELGHQQQALAQVRMHFVDILQDTEEEGEEPTEALLEEEPLVTTESALDLTMDEITFDLPQSVFNPAAPIGEPEDIERERPLFPLSVIQNQTNAYGQEQANGEISQLYESEKEVESVAAMLIANAAAAAAAEAESLAEASSLRTREARNAVIQADQVLTQIRSAIQLGTLSGAEAETILQQVERASTEAHAALADAEAVEERAISTAMNAEAEAEVAEGMALASRARNEGAEEEQPWQRLIQTDEHLAVSEAELDRAAAQVEADETAIRQSSQQEFA